MPDQFTPDLTDQSFDETPIPAAHETPIPVQAAIPSTRTGVAVIEAVLATLPLSPGVYRMLDARGEPLYVGKARSLRKRVANYTQTHRLEERLRCMVRDTASMEIVTTHTEAEALLLEANLIKRLKPRYNIVLRDDKSYPWLMLAEDHAFPQVTKHRGSQSRPGSYWGPFASAWAVNQTVNAMERLFLLRSCADTVFANRSRPCLLHQIKRCSAPCVDRISREDYAASGGPGARLPVRQGRHPAARAVGGDGGGLRAHGVRARGRRARPHPRADPRAGQPG